MKVKIKKLDSRAVIPHYSKPGDAGMDLTAVNVIDEGKIITYDFKLSMEIPNGYVGLIFPRSSVYKTGMILSNAVGVVDSGYRGSIMAKFYKDNSSMIYAEGERCAQIIILPYPQIEFELVEEISQTERGTGGYGSTGA